MSEVVDKSGQEAERKIEAEKEKEKRIEDASAEAVDFMDIDDPKMENRREIKLNSVKSLRARVTGQTAHKGKE